MTAAPVLVMVQTKITDYGFADGYSEGSKYYEKGDDENGELTRADIEAIGGDFEDYEEVGIKERYEDYSVHLTVESAERFIRENKHHLTDPRTYVKHSWRVPEIKTMLTAIGIITDELLEGR
jgi:hypothetical protein